VAELRSLGLDPASVLDFSANISPLGPPPRVHDALRAVDLSRYPDPDCAVLRDALSERLGISPSRVLVGNGSTELIHLVARACLDQRRSGLVFTPTFGEYSAACRAADAPVVEVRARDQTHFQWDMDAALEQVGRVRPGVVFLCNPNNPTGMITPMEQMARLWEAVGEHGLLVVDEAYLAFVEEPWDSTILLRMPNVLLLRSMTKDYALAALRLGYLVGPEPLVRRLRLMQPSWSVNAMAQAAGAAALLDDTYLETARGVVACGKAYLMDALADLGLRPLPSAANFLLVRVGDATALRQRLLRAGVCVRDCTSFGLPEHIRIGVRGPEECRKLVDAMAEATRNG
jgi:histidinol-phosphate aminotransferase